MAESEQAAVGSTQTVVTERMATGGEAVGRLADGRVVFVSGAFAGETVQVEISRAKKRFCHGEVMSVVVASPSRIDPDCQHHVAGECGGCDWKSLDRPAQRLARVDIAAEQLERLGGVPSARVAHSDLPSGPRTTIRAAVTDGRAGFRSRRSSNSFVAQSCERAHDLVEDLLVNGDFGDSTEVTLRVGAQTGERMAIVNNVSRAVTLPSDVRIVAAVNPTGHVTEIVAGKQWRISAASFFQTSQRGAEALVAEVTSMITDTTGPVVDFYAGVGLLGGAAAPDRLVASVESNPSSSADAGHNLDDEVSVDNVRVERWRGPGASVVIADPARRGLGVAGADAVARTSATSLILVSCDPASLGRDAGLLTDAGWTHDRSVVVDMFADTSRLEVVSRFDR